MDEMATPGRLLGTEEEFVGGEGVYSESGKLYALYAGEVVVDKQKVISVKPSAAIPRMIVPGMVVYGRIEDIFEPIALVKLETLESHGARQAQADYFSILHVSNIRRDYVKSLRSEVRIGDVIKAMVSEIRRGEAYLDIRGAEFGVVKAYCSRCRNPLFLKDRALLCNYCGNVESRKLSKEYSTIQR